MSLCKQTTELFYLAFCVWREARGESRLTQTAVAYSILNRVAKPKWWGKTVDEVITKKWQYSSLTDPRDPQLTTWPKVSDPSWQQCFAVAEEVLNGSTVNPTPGADSYYDISIPPPKWTVGARPCGQVGRIVFYDTDHDQG